MGSDPAGCMRLQRGLALDARGHPQREGNGME